MIYPKPLKQGATIGLVQPSGAISKERYKKAIEKIESLGFTIYQLPELPRKLGYLGGSDQEKVDELHHMFTNPEVDAIWCVRGGYGTQRHLHLLDYELIAQNSKPFIGFSDITALANSITKECGFVTYHGIMGVSEFSEFDVSIFRKVVFDQDFPVHLTPLEKHVNAADTAFHPFVIKKGIALGKLVGGNLALLAAAIGTPFDVDYSGKILFLEDISEAPYSIDRMLTQMIHAGKLDNVAGVALGIFKDCHPKDHGWEDEDSLSLREVIEDRLSHLNVPVLYGLPFGHIDENATLPIGGNAKLDADNMELTLLR